MTVELLCEIIRAQARLLVAYRTGRRAPEKALDVLAEHSDLITEIVTEGN